MPTDQGAASREAIAKPTDQGAAGREALSERAAEYRAADPAKLTKALRTVIAGAPRLTAEQVDRLRALLPPADDHAAS